MNTLKAIAFTKGNVAVIPLTAGHIRRYITLLAGAGLTTASFLVSGMHCIFLSKLPNSDR